MTSVTSGYFSEARVGRIFSQAAGRTPDAPAGPASGAIAAIVDRPDLTQVEVSPHHPGHRHSGPRSAKPPPQRLVIELARAFFVLSTKDARANLAHALEWRVGLVGRERAGIGGGGVMPRRYWRCAQRQPAIKRVGHQTHGGPGDLIKPLAVGLGLVEPPARPIWGLVGAFLVTRNAVTAVLTSELMGEMAIMPVFRIACVTETREGGGVLRG